MQLTPSSQPEPLNTRSRTNLHSKQEKNEDLQMLNWSLNSLGLTAYLVRGVGVPLKSGRKLLELFLSYRHFQQQTFTPKDGTVQTRTGKISISSVTLQMKGGFTPQGSTCRHFLGADPHLLNSLPACRNLLKFKFPFPRIESRTHFSCLPAAHSVHGDESEEDQCKEATAAQNPFPVKMEEWPRYLGSPSRHEQ